MGARELKDVTYVANWLSPVGALAGALRALGAGVPPPPYLTGISGHAFQLVLTEGPEGLAPPAPAIGPAYRRAIAHYAELGVRAELLEVSPNDGSGRETALAAIRRSIDKKRPVIAFGLHLHEFGLIRGYNDERGQLIVSTLTTEQHGPALPLALWPPPGSQTTTPVLLLERAGRFDRKGAERAALRFATAEARAEAGDGETAVGLASYDRWREALLGAERIDGRGNAYTIQVTLAARREAAQFLDAVAERGGDAPASLRAAAAAYRDETLTLSRLSSLFPYPHGGDIGNAKVREQGARMLDAALAHERTAIAALETAVSAMI